jgi:glycosyltransferase involved in cell wall biosynthesis
MKKISIVTPAYNEEQNVEELYNRVKNTMLQLKDCYSYEHIFIDNCSSDGTVNILKNLAKSDSSLKIIVNSRNFGHIRSPIYGLFQATGDAVILLVSDLQDPPEMLIALVKKWEEGFKSVVAVKRSSEESSIMFSIRKLYYRLVNKLSSLDLIDNFTGFGLYDRQVIDILKSYEDPYPYFRGMIPEVGLSIYKMEYDQPVRVRGITKNNFYTLYDIGMLGIISHSHIPLRLATMFGFLLSAISLLVALFYLILKIIFWDGFDLGVAPVVVGLFFFASVQLFFIGIIGEYVASIHTYVKKRPLVIESERVNF